MDRSRKVCGGEADCLRGYDEQLWCMWWRCGLLGRIWCTIMMYVMEKWIAWEDMMYNYDVCDGEVDCLGGYDEQLWCVWWRCGLLGRIWCTIKMYVMEMLIAWEDLRNNYDVCDGEVDCLGGYDVQLWCMWWRCGLLEDIMNNYEWRQRITYLL